MATSHFKNIKHMTKIGAAILLTVLFLGSAGCGQSSVKEEHCDAVFYGDSITEGNNFDELFPDLHIVDCGRGGATIEDLTESVGNVGAHHPDKIFVLAGGNDLDYTNVEQCVELYRGLLDALCKECPYAEIFVESMLPLDKKVAYSWGCPNPTIRKFNSRLEELAAEYGMEYIDIYPAYETSDGLNKKMTEDGVHLNPDAYGPWAQIVRPYLKK